jgi:predicted porin
VVLGRHDTPYKMSTTKYNVFADTIADYAATRLDNVALITGHSRASNAIAYLSPNFSGLSFQGAVVTSMDHLDAGDTVDAISLAAGYANGPLTVDLGWENIEGTTANNERKAMKLGAGYSFGAAKIGAIYEDVNMSGTGQDRDSLFLVGSYAMGAIVLKGQYGQADVGAADMKAWALGADYNLSKRTTAFVVYGNGDDDVSNTLTGTAANADGVKGWNIGMTHNF